MNFEPAVMRKLERWSKEENEEEYIQGKTDDFADAYYTMLQRIRNDYPDAEVVCMIPYHTIYSAALPVLLEDTEKEAAIISMMRMAEWCVTAGQNMKEVCTISKVMAHR